MAGRGNSQVRNLVVKQTSLHSLLDADMAQAITYECCDFEFIRPHAQRIKMD